MSIQPKHKEFNINQRTLTEGPHNLIKDCFKLSKDFTKERKLLMKSWSDKLIIRKVFLLEEFDPYKKAIKSNKIPK